LTADKTRVLIVDDSPVAREIIATVLSVDGQIEIIGQAANGQEAIDSVVALKPDLVTMDITMPVMDGLAAIEHIMAYNPTPILVVTASQEAGLAYRAISRGALEVLEKPALDAGDEGWRGFTERAKILAGVRVIPHLRGRRPPPATADTSPIEETFTLPETAAERKIGKLSATDTIRLTPGPRKPRPTRRVIAVGASTGGPAALSQLLQQLPANLPAAILVVQHIARGFTQGLIEWLSTVTRLRVKEAEEGELIARSVVYVAPAGNHLLTVPGGRLALDSGPAVGGQRPSVDVLFNSVQREYGARAVGILLTGMGRDGAQGLKNLHDSGALTIAQDEETSVVYGMPRAAVEMRAAAKVLPIQSIAGELMRLFAG
jgi:two-component system chemotaxis response regulator CheB